MLDIDMEFKHGILVVRLYGILNGDTSIYLYNDLTQVINNNGIKYVLLNLNNLNYIDKYGIKVIFNNYERIVKNKGKLIICGINKLFDYSFDITDNLYQINDEVSAYNLIKI